MRTVRLHGHLAEKFGKEFELEVATVRQALSILAANFPTFKQEIVGKQGDQLAYEVWSGEYNLRAEEEDFIAQGTGAIDIVPAVAGSSSTARIILGVVLVVVGVLGNTFGWWAGGSAWGTYLIMTGIGLIAGGVAEKLSPKPKTSARESVDSATSYIFNGSQNNTRQGAPIAVGYGKFLVGSSVISLSMTTSDIPV